MTREFRLRIDVGFCKACRRCLAAQVCKVRALLRMDADEPPFIDIARCYDCCLCIPACPFGAISIAPSSVLLREAV